MRILSVLLLLFAISAQAAPKPGAAAAAAKKGDSVRVLKTALNAPEDVLCQDAYARLYGKGSANFRVVFGYKDTRPSRFVGDRHERLVFVQKILRSCEPGQFACGFVRDTENADMFYKTIAGVNPTQPIKINLFVANSSVGSDDQANREDEFQKWRTVYAKKAFYEGILKADVVLYNGHSRFGGGPDFDPPRLLKNGEVDSSYYTRERPGLQTTRARLRERARQSDKSEDGLKMLGLFSCGSSQHFANEVMQDSDTGFISSRALIYYADALESSLASLSAMLEMRCEKDFRLGLSAQGAAVRASQLEGFFSRE